MKVRGFPEDDCSVCLPADIGNAMLLFEGQRLDGDVTIWELLLPSGVAPFSPKVESVRKAGAM